MSETTQKATPWIRRGRHIEDLSDAEILALAISNEEQATQAYTGFAEALRADYPDTARMFTEMAQEETGHRHKLVELFKSKFGETIPKIEAADVRGLLQEKPSALAKLQGPEGMRRQARQMEANASRFYHQAASRTLDVTIRNVLGDLAVAEAAHEQTADEMAFLFADAREGFPGWPAEHAAIMETSLVMALRPELVRTEKIADDRSAERPFYEVIPTPPEHVAPSGVLAEASKASPEKGERLVSLIVDRLTAALRDFD